MRTKIRFFSVGRCRTDFRTSKNEKFVIGIILVHSVIIVGRRDFLLGVLFARERRLIGEETSGYKNTIGSNNISRL